MHFSELVMSLSLIYCIALTLAFYLLHFFTVTSKDWREDDETKLITDDRMLSDKTLSMTYKALFQIPQTLEI